MPKQPAGSKPRTSTKCQAKQDQPKKKRGGGPKTVEGKKASRYNAVKHGLTAGQLVVLLADETAEQYEALRAGWLEEFEPEGFAEKTLVDELIRAHWLFQRAQRRLMETERAIAGDDNAHPVDWPEEDERKIELLQRYKTSHERSYYRALNMVRQFWKDRLDAAMKMPEMLRENDELQREHRELREQERKLQQELEAKRGGKPEPEATPENVTSEDANDIAEKTVRNDCRQGALGSMTRQF